MRRHIKCNAAFERRNDMSQVLQDVPEKVKKSVLSGTIIVNSILLLFHISFREWKEFYCYFISIIL